MQGLTIKDNDEDFTIVAQLIPHHLRSDYYNSFYGDCKVLSAGIAFEIRNKFIPLHKLNFSLKYLSAFIQSCLNESKQHLIAGQLMRFSVTPRRGSVTIVTETLGGDKTPLTRSSYTRPLSIIDHDIPEDSEIDSGLQPAGKKVFGEILAAHTRMRKEVRMRMVLMDVGYTQLSKDLGLSDSQVKGAIYVPSAKAIKTDGNLERIHKHLLELELKSCMM